VLFLAEAERLGLDSAGDVRVRTGEPESFRQSAQILKMRRPDAVFIVGTEDPCRAAALMLRREGVSSVFLGTDALKPSRTLITPGFDGPGPYLVSACADAANQAPEFHNRFQARFGPHHSSYTVEAYDAARWCLAALRRVGSSNRKEILTALRTVGYAGLSGRVRFDPMGERVDQPVAVYRCDGTQLKFLGIDRSGGRG
jgi:branched-chain amino acid transport system substrate-binding protein